MAGALASDKYSREFKILGLAILNFFYTRLNTFNPGKNRLLNIFDILFCMTFRREIKREFIKIPNLSDASTAALQHLLTIKNDKFTSI